MFVSARRSRWDGRRRCAVAPDAVALALPERICDATRDHDPAQRQVTRRDPLGEHDHVGRHAETLDPEPGAEPSEPGDHRVADEQDPVAAAEVGDPLEVARGRVQDAAGADHRLEEEGGHALGTHPLDLLLERGQRVVLHLGGIRDQRTEGGAVALDATEARAEAEHAVETAAAADHMRPVRLALRSPVEASELRGGLDAVAAACRQQNPCVVHRREVGEPPGERIGEGRW